MKAADGKIAERYTGVYAKWAQSPFLHESPLICGLIEELSAAEERERKLLDSLADPATVHTNILRGTIALTKAQAIHIAGLPADIEERERGLREALGRYKGVRDGFGDVTADAALAPPRPEQPVRVYECTTHGETCAAAHCQAHNQSCCHNPDTGECRMCECERTDPANHCRPAPQQSAPQPSEQNGGSK